MDNVNQLINKIKQCTLCSADLPFKPNPVIQISPFAKILIIGQAPGLLAHQISTPFKDKSGERLRLWLGVSEQQFYDETQFAIMPMAFCYPGKNKQNSGDAPPPKICQQTWHQLLLKQLTQVRLTIVIGQYAAKQYVDEFSNLTNAIEKNTETNKDMVLLPHPSGRNNIWLAKNKWFETKTLPIIRQRIKDILSN